ncbi:MAG: phage major capsid protein [Candidatus Azobacteroides sp.]|nr:phage major capsid protein [Candidatus Azobacteroides sp.]
MAEKTISFVGFAKKESELTTEEKQTLGNIEKQVNGAVTSLLEKSNQEVDSRFKEFETKLDKMNQSGSMDEFLKELKSFKDDLKSLNKEVADVKAGGINIYDNENPLFKQIDEIYESEKFKSFMEGKTKSSGKIELKLKDAVTSITNNYTGDRLITQQSPRVVPLVNERSLNIRDLMIVDRGEDAFPAMSFTQIYDLDRNAANVSENGRLPKSSFKIREEHTDARRIGTYLDISRRLLKSRIYVRSFIVNRLPLWVRMAEDFQIMFGDGQGDTNLKGITRYEGVKCVSKYITENIVTGGAGSVKSVSGYADGNETMVEFSSPQNKIETGQKITFANAGTGLDGTFTVKKMNDNNIVVEAPYSDAVAEDITFEVRNDFFNNTEAPNISDAVAAIFALMTYAEYTPNFIALNPSTVFQAETAKDTTGRNLDLVTVVNGIKYIAGRPIIETSSVIPGKYFTGDMINGAALVDYTTLTLEFAEDRESMLQNFITLIAQEEVMLPVYNPFSFAYGNIQDVLNAIEKA